MAKGKKESVGDKISKFFGPYTKDVGVIMTGNPLGAMAEMFLKPYKPSQQFLNDVAEKISGRPSAYTQDRKEPSIRYGRLLNIINPVTGLFNAITGSIAGGFDLAIDKFSSKPTKLGLRLIKSVIVTPFFLATKALELASLPINAILDGGEKFVRFIAGNKSAPEKVVPVNKQKNEVVKEQQPLLKIKKQNTEQAQNQTSSDKKDDLSSTATAQNSGKNTWTEVQTKVGESNVISFEDEKQKLESSSRSNEFEQKFENQSSVNGTEKPVKKSDPPNEIHGEELKEPSSLNP